MGRQGWTIGDSRRHQYRDEKIASQAERLGKIETSVGFIVPTSQRIEVKLDAVKP